MSQTQTTLQQGLPPTLVYNVFYSFTTLLPRSEEYRSENRPPLIIGVAQSSPWEKEENGHLLFLS